VGVRPGAELLWFPQGGIGVFPMHAAWCASGGKRKWLADEYAIRHAPSIKALAAAAARPAHGSNAVLVVNPGEDLPFAEVESAWTQRQIAPREYRVLRGAGATKPAVLGTLEDVRTIHFASHAVFDWERPAESYLRLAGSDRLKLDELLPQLRGSGLDLVVLSACETAVARVTATPDEFLGFPAAFLHGGARTVVATLWPVSDAATALLMRRFYAELQDAHATTAEAMRRAQMWLRVATTHEVLRLLGELRDEPDPVGGLVAQLRVKLRATDPDTCPFAAPFYWAAFVVVGH
jgi:CHAT domain-containing protein